MFLPLGVQSISERTCHWLILFSPLNLASLPDEIEIGANFFADEFQRLVDSTSITLNYITVF